MMNMSFMQIWIEIQTWRNDTSDPYTEASPPIDLLDFV